MAEVKLTPAEVQRLGNHYEGPDGHIDYRGFCDQIDRIFTEKHLEQSPTRMPRRFSKEIHPFGTATTEAEDARAKLAMNKIRQWVHVRGVILKTYAADFDVSNNGYITERQFRRVLQMLNSKMSGVNDSEMDALCKRYRDANGDVNYRSFHEDASQSPEILSVPTSPKRVYSEEDKRRMSIGIHERVPTQAVVTADEVMSRLIRLVSSQRIRIKEAFADFDKMRTGCVTAPHFRRGLKTAFRNSFEESELDLLVDRFRASADQMGSLGLMGADDGEAVSYRALCDEVDSAFTEPGLERSPTKRIGTSRAAQIAKGPRYAPSGMSAAEEFALTRYLTHMRVKVQQRRIDMKDIFKDFDRNQRETVTQDQFCRVLKMYELLDMGMGGVDLLLRRFGFKSSAHGVRLVHYNAFLAALLEGVEPFVWSDGAGSFGTNTKFLAKGPTGYADQLASMVEDGGGGRRGRYQDHSDQLPAIMHSIRTHVSGKRVRLREFFRDYDQLRKGRITFVQFTAGLQRAMKFLPPDHITAVVKAYLTVADGSADRWAGPDAEYPGGQPTVSWRRFCDEVDEVFTLPGLEKNPTCDVLGATASALELGSPKRSVDPSTESLGRATLKELTLHVATRNKLVAPDFQAFDAANTGTLPNTQFVRALSSAFSDFITADKDRKFGVIADLYKVFDINKEREYESTLRFDVDYRSFCRDIDSGLQRANSKDEQQKSYDDMVERTLKMRAVEHAAHEAQAMQTDDQAVAEVMTTLQQTVKGRRINLKSFMQAHDPLRSGRLTRAKFTTALVMALGTQAATLSKYDMDKIAVAYMVRDGSSSSSESNPDIDYIAFVFDLTSEGAEDLERNPTKEIQPVTFDAKPAAAEWPGDIERLSRVLKEIQRTCAVSRLNVKPFFQVSRLPAGGETKQESRRVAPERKRGGG